MVRSIKNAGKSLLLGILGWQVRRLVRRHSCKVVAVVGSYGKTSTKFAIAAVLGEQFRVRFQKGNYNDIVTVPLVFFDETLPSLLNPIAWARLLTRNERALRRPLPYDVVVVELGTNGPGDIAAFGRYLRADIAVVTSLAMEHMAFFADVAAVAREELTVASYSRQVVANADLCAAEYLATLSEPPVTYGREQPADYRVEHPKLQNGSFHFALARQRRPFLDARFAGVSKAQLYSAAAAAAVADLLGMKPAAIAKGIAAITPASGRLQVLRGIRGSTILDESYNAAPDTMKAALDLLYETPAPHKVALLGNMNELGAYSAGAHREVGAYCDPEHIELLLTLGPDANEYLAPAAEARGCRVERFTSPHDAGKRLHEYLKPGSLVLAKGSQNRVYAEEAIKPILADPADAQLLVRQSPAWLAKKRKQFRPA